MVDEAVRGEKSLLVLKQREPVDFPPERRCELTNGIVLKDEPALTTGHAANEPAFGELLNVAVLPASDRPENRVVAARPMDTVREAGQATEEKLIPDRLDVP